ncbi:hypothetical protein GALL_439220 [mine drainage metagenome]|uniref:Uncharacterized protein n=1 Tax=mine drainage metagenome TaxID=410659 RepID=A0A1J5QAA3_9ZZZZ
MDATCCFSDLSNTLWLTCFEEFDDTWETVGDVITCDTTGVEGTHGELSSRLTDRLGGDDSDSLADIDALSGCK